VRIPNTTHGSGWIVQVQAFPWQDSKRVQRSTRRSRDLNDPPTAVGGISSDSRAFRRRQSRNIHPLPWVVLREKLTRTRLPRLLTQTLHSHTLSLPFAPCMQK